jgi:general secretion pathway protein G
MVELVFVIVILGILAAVAIPKLAASRTDAEIVKGRTDLAAIRSSIETERQQRLFRGDSAYVTALDDAAANTAGEELFDGPDTSHRLLPNPTISGSGSGKWMKTSTGTPSTYTYNVDGTVTTFEYNASTGVFGCTINCENFQ